MKVDLALETVPIAGGGTVEREVVLHRGAVCMLPMLEGDRVCLVKNYRYAAGRELIEVPAGTLDPGETPLQTATRELREETGYTTGRLEELAAWWVSPGVFTERMHLFVCTELVPGEPELQPDEKLEPLIVLWDEALAMVADGRIDDAKSMLAIMLGDAWRKGCRPLSPR